MNHPRIADLVARSLMHFDGKRYELHAWCVMPNHVHVIFTPESQRHVRDIVHSWKSFTSNAANAVLQRNGRFWQPEYFDRIIRDERDLANSIRYVLENPEKARLTDWKWTSKKWTAG